MYFKKNIFYFFIFLQLKNEFARFIFLGGTKNKKIFFVPKK